MKYLNDTFNGAELVDAPSYKYNCHAYAWHVSEGGDKVWIGRYSSTAEDIYWTDGSYTEVSESEATKVSYHESGNHSAIKLSDEWYQSKWGPGPVVKHHLNDVPSIYNPGMTKKYYDVNLPPMSITGQTFVCSSADYSVSNLPAGATVNWTYTPVSPNTKPGLQQNVPSTNSCTVSNTYGQVFEGYLNADIMISGKIKKTISKTIYGDSDKFIGFYWQPSGDGSWVPDMSISLEEPNVAIPPNDVIIESDNFRGKRVSCTALGITSILQTSSSNRVSFEMPSLPSGELLTIRVYGYDCSSPITFTFESQNYAKSSNGIELSIKSVDANCYNISVVQTEPIGMLAVGSDSKQSIAKDASSWIIEVYNVMNSRKIMERNVIGTSYLLDTSALPPGIYVLRAIINGKIYEEKIQKQ